MSNCLEKLSHSCGTSDALQVFIDDTDHVQGYCFACDTYVPHPYGEDQSPPKRKAQVRTPEQVQQELETIASLKTVSLPDRKLSQKALEYFGVKIGLSEQDGTTPVFHYYPIFAHSKLVGYKTRLIAGKKFWHVGETKNADLFGWKQALASGAKTLYITEGECDAVALYQALKEKNRGSDYSSYDPAVVSISKGSGTVRKEFIHAYPLIRKTFKEVVLVFDQDKAGQAAVHEAMQIIPHARSAQLPAKDANECLMLGYEIALCHAVLFKATTPKNTRLVWGREFIAAGRTQSETGLSWPWPMLTRLTRGIRKGETIYLGSGVKMGKTTMVSTLAAHYITEHNLNVFCVQPEEANVKTWKLIVGKVAKRVFTDPNIPFDYDAYDKAAPFVGEKLLMLNIYQELTWNDLRVDILDAIDKDCEAIFIDPITNLTAGIEAAKANIILQELAVQVSILAKDLNITVFLFCHLKAPESGPPHERGGKIFSNQFAGSRAMMRSCNLMLGLEGNKDPDLDEEERNLRRLVILEDREFGATGYVPLFYNTLTGLYHEIK